MSWARMNPDFRFPNDPNALTGQQSAWLEAVFLDRHKQGIPFRENFGSNTDLDPSNLIAVNPKDPKVNLLYVDSAGVQNNWRRAWGHVVLDVNGTAYNMTQDGNMQKIPTRNYIEGITNKSIRKEPPQNIHSFPVNLSEGEVSRALRELNRPHGEYQFPNNTCATCTMDALQKATKGSKKPIHRYDWIGGITSWKHLSPSDVVDSVKKSGRISGPEKTYTEL